MVADLHEKSVPTVVADLQNNFSTALTAERTAAYLIHPAVSSAPEELARYILLKFRHSHYQMNTVIGERSLLMIAATRGSPILCATLVNDCPGFGLHNYKAADTGLDVVALTVLSLRKYVSDLYADENLSSDRERLEALVERASVGVPPCLPILLGKCGFSARHLHYACGFGAEGIVVQLLAMCR